MQTILHDNQDAPRWTEVSLALDDAVNALSMEDREAILQRYFQKLDYKQIGGLLDMSESGARCRTE